ncbi:NAD-binding protein [Pusillimonas noertemannii]|uniref:NAD-binding protein n=1 Tax=Pusillimonas noertemannii TaxID=305977 RepID=UPI002447886A|nr:NAD-binding protein [Pusillimonas noertemannii]
MLSSYSSDVVHSGGVGTAQVSKAVNNLILWACLVANHEGMALANRYGVDTDALREALMMSSAVNGALGNWGKQSMAWAQDDMNIVAEMADDCGISLPQSGLVREICRTLRPRRYQIEQYGS